MVEAPTVQAGQCPAHMRAEVEPRPVLPADAGLAEVLPGSPAALAHAALGRFIAQLRDHDGVMTDRAIRAKAWCDQLRESAAAALEKEPKGKAAVP